MRPLDDELRAVLTSRADSLPLVPDPIVGIERRARRMRRNRIAAAVAGTALAVTGIAVAVPALLTDSSTDSLPQYAVTPSPQASPSAAPASRLGLDPADPWPYRGASTAELGQGTLETVEREYAVRRGVDQGALELTPLFGQVHEPSQQAEVVFLARLAGGEVRWGVSRGGGAGPEFVVDEPLGRGRTALPAALPGDDGVPRLLVVASPEAGAVQYGPDGATGWQDLASRAPGVGIGPLEGFPENDRVRVLDPAGAVVFDQLAPDPPGGFVEAPSGSDADGRSEDEGPGTDVTPTAAPSNVVDWPTRGLVDGELYLQALRAFARETGAAPEAVDAKVLYAGSREGRNVMLLQAWTRGEDARTFGYLEAAGTETTWLGGTTAPGPAVLAFLVPAEAALLPNDLLVVVPEPAAAQVLYGGEDGAAFAEVPDQGTGTAVLIDRAPGARGDQLQVRERAGDPESTLYLDAVDDLLATF